MPITTSTPEAMALLKLWRAAQIEDAREVACELIELHGWTTSKRVQEVMVERDLIDPTLGNFWLGAVFNDPMFVWTGQWEYPEGEPGTYAMNKAHAWRPMKKWTLRKSKNPFDFGKG